MIDIGYIMNYMKVFEWSREDFITLYELEKMFNLFSNSIDWEILGQMKKGIGQRKEVNGTTKESKVT
jgi:hypothetical protein